MNRSLVIVLASVILSSNGRRVTMPSKEVPETASATRPVPLKDLSKLLLAFNPAVTASRPTGLSKQNPFVGQRKAFDFQRGETPLMRGGAIPIEKRTDFGAVVGTASLLSMASGMVNIIAFLEMGIPCTHHTGSATHAGRLIGKLQGFGDLDPATAGLSIALLVVTYVLGAAVSGATKGEGEKVFAGKLSLGILGSALTIAFGAVLRQMTGLIVPILAIWSFASGWQNAITTSAAAFVGFPVRTTHMTGAATDLGSGLGQWFSAVMGGKPAPSLRKPIVFGSCILAYGVGGFLARLIQPTYGALTALLPAALLALLALPRPVFTTVSETPAPAAA
mmetsp:Transcript_83335/g.137821  ORF Transcript_83335/g.137821 Transcript_83335/m.137821 type:complete len:335 (+) Transcript_83335:117-1121(+)